MVLSGALKEFILGDVFNLLSQQRITGKLTLASDKREGGIVFQEGIIVGAECGEDNLPGKLFNYLVDVKGLAPESLTQLFNSQAGNLSSLCSTLTERSFLTSAELKNFAECCVEDMCCSLLMWNQGTYRFNSMRGVATMACGAVSISVENIIMEGMRRADEWVRMQEYIKGEMIFVPTVKRTPGSDDAAMDPASRPEEYVISLLNGSSTVKAIVKSCCLCEYKVYETISTLLQTQRISALHQKYSQSIQAALKRKDAEEASVLGKTFFSNLVSSVIAAAIILVFLSVGVLGTAAIRGRDRGAEASHSNAAESARLLHRAINGDHGDGFDLDSLKDAGFLTTKDYKY